LETRESVNSEDGSESDSSESGSGEDKEEKSAARTASKEEALHAIKEMVGLKPVMEHIHNIMAKIELAKRQGVDLKEERLGTVFLGNSGTGELQNPSQSSRMFHSIIELSIK
jgi:hypothetical protein